MTFVADLHIHSHYSLATSKELTPPMLDAWARKKGIGMLGTGDCIHPGWMAELEEMLEENTNGLLRLKDAFRSHHDLTPCSTEPAFVLTTEISNIYKRDGRVRKVHNILVFPTFEAAKKLQSRLLRMKFNITSDGRPILGLDSRDLLAMLLESSPDALLIPAHIWTPWFSAMGSKSGFDSIEACYGDLTSHISAIETGLSSDAPMNWLIPSLDRFTLLSNSDAHSPEKLGRNANLFHCEPTYEGLTKAMQEGPSGGFGGTIDMFPQEGKYHYAGHRKCGVVMNPAENLLHRGICPVCHKPLTEGVVDRIAQLAGRSNPLDRPVKAPFRYVIPLKEMLAQLLQSGENSKKVSALFNQLLQRLGPELQILLDIPLEQIATTASPLITEAIRRMRHNEVTISEGYDGEYGTIRVFSENEINEFGTHRALFTTRPPEAPIAKPLLRFDPEALMEAKRMLQESANSAAEPESIYYPNPPAHNLSQQMAVEHSGTPALVVAGPGTGKTRVLTQRIAWLINHQGVPPQTIVAITFTRKAAREMTDRLAQLLPATAASQVQVNTFHNWGLVWLQQHATEAALPNPFSIAGGPEKLTILNEAASLLNLSLPKASETIARHKQTSVPHFGSDDEKQLFDAYNRKLTEYGLTDVDDLVLKPLLMMKENEVLATNTRQKINALLIDEYQDINQVQYELIRQLAADNPAKIFAIGDPNQSIYSFRGSDSSYINRFQADYPDAVMHTLRQSYRCPLTVLTAASEVLRLPDKPGSSRPGTRLVVATNPTAASEAEYIARTIDKLTGGTRFFAIDSGVAVAGDLPSDTDPAQIAVLARTHRQLNGVCKALDDHAIPWRIYHHAPPFTKGTAARIIALLKALMQPQSIFHQQQADSLIHPQTLSGTLRKEAENRSTLIQTIDYLSGLLPEPPDDTLHDLLQTASDFGSDYTAFLHFLNTGTPVDSLMPGITAVSLLTLHASKGLDFDVVFIAGCDDGLIPYTLRHGAETKLEEEGRLLYVGMTRARNMLFLTHATERTIFGEALRLSPSRFLETITPALLRQQKQVMKAKPTDTQLSLF